MNLKKLFSPDSRRCPAFYLLFPGDACTMDVTKCRKVGTAMENRDNMDHAAPRRPNPRRKKRNPVKRFIRAYMPLLVVVLLIILFIIFAVGSVKRANEKREAARQESLAIESSIAQQQLDWEAEAAALMVESEKYAASCDFEKAIEVLKANGEDAYVIGKIVASNEEIVIQ